MTFDLPNSLHDERQIQQHSAPLDLQQDSACRYCGTPVSILDPDAVAKTVTALADAQTRRSTVDVDALASALLTPPPPDASRRQPAGDLVAAGIAAVAALLLSRM